LTFSPFATAGTEVLTDVNKTLKEDDALRDDVNTILSKVDHEFGGKVEVKHFVRAFIEDIGIEKIRARVTNALNG